MRIPHMDFLPPSTWAWALGSSFLGHLALFSQTILHEQLPAYATLIPNCPGLLMGMSIHPHDVIQAQHPPVPGRPGTQYTHSFAT